MSSDYASLRFSASSTAIAAVFLFTKSHSSGVTSSFSRVMASLDVSSSELVECFHFLADLYHSKNHAGPSSVVEVTEIDGFSVASSPCAVDADLCDDLCSPAWAVDFCALLEKPHKRDALESEDCHPGSKRMRAI